MVHERRTAAGVAGVDADRGEAPEPQVREASAGRLATDGDVDAAAPLGHLVQAVVDEVLDLHARAADGRLQELPRPAEGVALRHVDALEAGNGTGFEVHARRVGLARVVVAQRGVVARGVIPAHGAVQRVVAPASQQHGAHAVLEHAADGVAREALRVAARSVDARHAAESVVAIGGGGRVRQLDAGEVVALPAPAPERAVAELARERAAEGVLNA